MSLQNVSVSVFTCHCVKSIQIRSFFWSVFFRIWTEYGDLYRKSPYSVQIRENTDWKKLRIWTFFAQCVVIKRRIKNPVKYLELFAKIINSFRSLTIITKSLSLALREKCPNTEFFLVRIFLYLDWIRRFTEKISVFSPNTGKYVPEKTPYLGTFHAV